MKQTRFRIDDSKSLEPSSSYCTCNSTFSNSERSLTTTEQLDTKKIFTNSKPNPKLKVSTGLPSSRKDDVSDQFSNMTGKSASDYDFEEYIRSLQKFNTKTTWDLCTCSSCSLVPNDNLSQEVTSEPFKLSPKPCKNTIDKGPKLSAKPISEKSSKNTIDKKPKLFAKAMRNKSPLLISQKKETPTKELSKLLLLSKPPCDLPRARNPKKETVYYPLLVFLYVLTILGLIYMFVDGGSQTDLKETNEHWGTLPDGCEDTDYLLFGSKC